MITAATESMFPGATLAIELFAFAFSVVALVLSVAVLVIASTQE